MAVNEQSEVPVSIQFCANCVHEIRYRFTVEVYRRLALLTTPTDRAAENQFLLLQSAGLGLRAMEYKKCKCCAKRRRTNKLTDWQ